MRSALALAACVAALAACGGGGGDEDTDDGYPPAAVDAFVEECRRDPNVSEPCRCVIERLQETMRYAEFEATDRALRASREANAAAIAKLRAAVTACGAS